MKYFSYLKKRFATRNAKRIKRIEMGNFITFCPILASSGTMVKVNGNFS